jgi:putative YhbY family RNA-binding protein
MLALTPAQRRDLRALAHRLRPTVAIGQHGLTPAVVHETDVALAAHELVKVRVFDDDRARRAALGEQLCAALACALVQHIGKLLVLWRPRPPETPAAGSPPRARPAPPTGRPRPRAPAGRPRPSAPRRRRRER